jgi:uncharacterized membrane protein (UPF0127 family)
MDRRRYLQATGAVALLLAGCGGKDASPAGESETPTPDTKGSPTTAEGTPTETAGTTSTADRATEIHAGYPTTEVRALTPAGKELGRVTAAVADTQDRRIVGLSDTPALPPDRGMLFVYESVADRTFVMREMDFGIDIVYADAAGSITRIHHAPPPGPDEAGSEQKYPGRGQYVLELVYGWTDDHGVSEGDVLAFDLL